MSNLVLKDSQKWLLEKSNYLEAYREISIGSLTISNKALTSATPHDACIMEDENQLSKMLVKLPDGSNDKTNIHKFIELFVIEIFEWFGKEISTNLTQDLAKKIYADFYWLKIAELKLFVERIKGGHWRQVHSMSPAVLMERLNTFALESMNIRESIGTNKNEPTFLSENGDLIYSKFKPIVEKLSEKIKEEEKRKAEKKAEKKPLTLWHKENEMCMEWLKQTEGADHDKIIWYNMFLLRK